jgi:sigma-E factor negative regulatory protein RseB
MLANSLARVVVVVVGFFAILTAQAATLERSEALRVLTRVASAAETVNYSGNYIYQYGDSVANYQITHLIEAGVSTERRVLLDGDAKEYIRTGDKVSMYPPQGSGFALDRRYTSKLFPNHLPSDLSGLLNSYSLSKIGRDRVAGREATIYQLDPLDVYRYPQRFWVDEESGLILKWLMMGMRQEMVQLFSFAQIQVGGKIDRKLLKPSNTVRPVAVVDGEAIDLANDPHWQIKPTIPGFKLIKQSTRNLPHKQREVLHHLYSDGVVTLSVFVEPMNANMPLGLAHQGPTHLYTRQVGANLVSCLGEVPAATVESFANAYIAR